jgi:hypothetical protein
LKIVVPDSPLKQEMDPLPMGAELVSEPDFCDLSFRNGGNDRFFCSK